MSYLSLAEAALVMRIPINVLREMCERGLIKGAVRFGHILAIPEEVCEKGLNSSSDEFNFLQSPSL